MHARVGVILHGARAHLSHAFFSWPTKKAFTRFFLAVAWLSSLESSLILVLVRLDCCGGMQYCSLPKRSNDVIKVTLRIIKSRVPTHHARPARCSLGSMHTHTFRAWMIHAISHCCRGHRHHHSKSFCIYHLFVSLLYKQWQQEDPTVSALFHWKRAGMTKSKSRWRFLLCVTFYTRKIILYVHTLLILYIFDRPLTSSKTCSMEVSVPEKRACLDPRNMSPFTREYCIQEYVII